MDRLRLRSTGGWNTGCTTGLIWMHWSDYWLAVRRAMTGKTTTSLHSQLREPSIRESGNHTLPNAGIQHSGNRESSGREVAKPALAEQ